MALAAYRKIPFPYKALFTNYLQVRTTYVVERMFPAPLARPSRRPSLRGKHHVYNTLQDNLAPEPRLLTIILRKYVEDVGKPGELVSIDDNDARILILTQQAAYPTPENLIRYGAAAANQKTYSSKYARTTMTRLSRFVIGISMNNEVPWTLEPWHVRVAFRKAGVHVPDSAITLPSNIISGPDMKIENKEFYVTITINGQEKQVVRCRICHWATGQGDVVPRHKYFDRIPVPLLFPEDREMAEDLPELIPPADMDEDEMQSILEKK